MKLGFEGQQVAAQDFGYTVSLTFTGGYEVRIETTFWLRSNDGDYQITPGEEAEANAPRLRSLIGQVVTGSAADDAGGLRVDFGDGSRLSAGADASYEAWTVAGPSGMKVACLPGGELAVWSPKR